MELSIKQRNNNNIKLLKPTKIKTKYIKSIFNRIYIIIYTARILYSHIYLQFYSKCITNRHVAQCLNKLPSRFTNNRLWGPRMSSQLSSILYAILQSAGLNSCNLTVLSWNFCTQNNIVTQGNQLV